MFDGVQYLCEFAVAALDGVYGWVNEAVAIVLFVVFFNFFAKRILKRLHLRFEKQKQVWKDSFVRALYTPMSYYVWFFATVQTLALIAVRTGIEVPIEQRHVLLSAVALIAFSWFLLRWKYYIVHHMIARSRAKEITIDQGKIDAIDKLVTVAILFFSILLLLEITHRSVNTIIAFGGVGGLALAFASQEIIANFFGGFMIYLTQPFTIGDWISIPDHSIEGVVEEIGWYMTRIRSLDKRPIYIPNAIFSKLIVITPSRMSHRQIKETIGIRCQDLPKIREIVHDLTIMLQNHPDIDQSQPIIARLSGFGQYSLDVTINVFTKTISAEGFTRIKEDVLLNIADVLDKHQAELSIPVQYMKALTG